jgi:hypothetical protein
MLDDEPGATRQAAVPVNPYAPWRFGDSAAAALTEKAIATADTDNANARCICFPLNVVASMSTFQHDQGNQVKKISKFGRYSDECRP